MHLHETDGLIIDFRFNTGGSMTPALAAYTLLFNTDVSDFGGWDLRGDTDDRFDMIPHPTFTPDRYVIHGEPDTFYDKPIAVLTGPNAVSAGDSETLRMSFHPMVRTFGKPTNGAFTLSDFPDLGNSEWRFQKATGSAYLKAGHQYLAHTTVKVDKEVWLTPDDVAQGRDTVVETAMAWIHQSITGVDDDIPAQKPVRFSLGNNYPNPFNLATTIKYDVLRDTHISLKIYNIYGQEIRTLVDEFQLSGNKSIVWDGKANDGTVVSSSVYFYRIETGDFSKTKRMLLLK